MDDGSHAAASVVPPVPQSRGLRFTGTGRGYFGIWIVNLALTLFTLGLYSPWAKVRRIPYFYGNTLLDGSPLGPVHTTNMSASLRVGSKRGVCGVATGAEWNNHFETGRE